MDDARDANTVDANTVHWMSKSEHGVGSSSGSGQVQQAETCVRHNAATYTSGLGALRINQEANKFIYWHCPAHSVTAHTHRLRMQCKGIKHHLTMLHVARWDSCRWLYESTIAHYHVMAHSHYPLLLLEAQHGSLNVLHGLLQLGYI